MPLTMTPCAASTRLSRRCAPERTLMVGDDAIADRGAHAARLAGVVLVDPNTPRAAPHHLDVVLDLTRR